jgi:hypothetical protein
MLGDSLAYPWHGDDWLKTILIGGILSILGVFIIPSLIVQGYLIRVLRSAANDEQEPPVFEEWVELTIDGLKVIIVQLVYFIVPLIVLFAAIAFVGFGAFSASQGSNLGAGIGLIGGLVMLVGFLLMLVAAYLLPAALANFAYNDDFGAAFDFGTVTDAAFTADYFVAVVLAIVVGIVLGFIGGLLTVILVGIFVLFYLQVVIYYLFGRGYAEGLGVGGSDAGAL